MNNALGRMRNIPNFFIWRLEWDSAHAKYSKKPCNPDHPSTNVDHTLASTRMPYEQAVAKLAALHAVAPPGQPVTYALGFSLDAACNLWFLDFDHALQQDGQWNALATRLIQQFPGAMVELSSSGRGLHVIGSGPVPPHRTKPPKAIAQTFAPMEMEFYHEGRGIAFGFQLGQAQGCADTVLDPAALCREYFPAETIKEGSDTRRPEWNGPEDDDELIALFMRSNQSPLGLISGRASIQQLWRGEVEKTNDADMALAAHLAYWTGCDGDRIERLMRRSGLYREKWDTHRTYLRELTIRKSCAGCERVYAKREMPPVPTLSAPAQLQGMGVTITVGEQVSKLLDQIAAAGTYEAIYDEVIPAVQQSGVPALHIERLAKAINKKLDFFDAKLPIGELRNLLKPKVTSVAVAGEVPMWVQQHCFVKKREQFYDCMTGSRASIVGFNAQYARNMPMRDNGRREIPAVWAFERWNIMVVDDALYHPREQQYFDYGGLTYVNTFRGLTPLEAFTPEVVQQINNFNTHLFLLCDRRQEVYTKLLQWIAHNVQHPGKKIKWAPLIKGVPGDGKSIITDVLQAAMGVANVKMTSTSVLSNKGGFTDWATGAAVNVIEEIRLSGAIRYELFEAMKNFIDLAHININAKGDKDYQQPNVTNHCAYSNFNDALPVDTTDRRWMIIISPNSDIMDAVRDRGLSSTDELVQWFKAIGDACRAAPGQWRAWLESVSLEGFEASGRAPETTDKSRMIASARSELDEHITAILERGGPGLHPDAFCSGLLQQTVRNLAMVSGEEVPKAAAWSATLARMGYEKLDKVMKWRGQTYRVWAKSKFARDQEMVRQILDQTVTNCNPTVTTATP